MKYRVALAGNPNCGKTTLFNELTGSNQYVGNWPGVTVEKKAGKVQYAECDLEVVDLPGIYSLSPYSIEEVVARDYILNDRPEAVINIVDGTNIERNLYLSMQLMELGTPVVLAVNMMDDVHAKGDDIDCGELASLLGIPVVPIVARRGEHLDLLLHTVSDVLCGETVSAPQILYDYNTENALNEILIVLGETVPVEDRRVCFYAAKLLEGDLSVTEFAPLSAEQKKRIETIAKRYEETSRYGDRETMVADARYRYITGVASRSVCKNTKPGQMTRSDRIDRIVTDRVLALPIFFMVMFLMFAAVFGPLGEGLKGCVEWLVGDCISPFIANLLTVAQAPRWCFSLLVDAVIGGVGGILTFLPQIMLLFFFLSILEDSGYMARGAFIMDRLLRKLGLSGKSFIPLLMGFGCTTPAVMAARTMENEQDRRLTIMLTPFMSCGAKLPIYALFAGIFFEKHQGLIVFSLYILGMTVAILCGLLLKNTLFKGERSAFVMELPPYRMPTFKSTMLHMWDKCKGFLIKAGTVIFSMSILIWLLQNFDFHLQMVSDSTQSIFGQIGALIAPVFKPLGFDSWQAAVSLLTGLVAKEAVVTSMAVLYGAGDPSALKEVLSGVFTPLSAYSFLVFTLLYMPCVAAFASMKREMNSWKWALGSVLGQTCVAYVVALLVYQIGRLMLG